MIRKVTTFYSYVCPPFTTSPRPQMASFTCLYFSPADTFLISLKLNLDGHSLLPFVGYAHTKVQPVCHPIYHPEGATWSPIWWRCHHRSFSFMFSIAFTSTPLLPALCMHMLDMGKRSVVAFLVAGNTLVAARVKWPKINVPHIIMVSYYPNVSKMYSLTLCKCCWINPPYFSSVYARNMEGKMKNGSCIFFYFWWLESKGIECIICATRIEPMLLKEDESLVVSTFVE